jgi:predicted nucleotidyltransferase
MRNILCKCITNLAYAYYHWHMDFGRPFRAVVPTLDGDVLAVLARADADFTGRELARQAGHGTSEGIRRAASRLVEEGVVLRRGAGNANLYRLNRHHVAAPFIEGLATLPERVIERLRAIIADWDQPASFAFLFGSVARHEASPASDLDLLVVRSRGADPDNEAWRAQLVDLQQSATALTGNDARVLEVGEEELGAGRIEQVLQDVLEEGVELVSSRRELRRLLDTRSAGGRSHAAL